MLENNSSSVRLKVSTLFWENKISLIIILFLLLLCIMFLPNLGVLIAVAFVLLSLFIGSKHGSFKSIGFYKQESWRNTIINGMLLGAAVQLAFSILFDPLIEKLTGIPIDLSNFESMRGNLLSYLVWLVIGFGFGGFLEEITFRGYLITRFKILLGSSSLSLIAILLLTSVSFGIAHLYQDWSGVISTGCFALVFGVIFIQSKYNLWMPILTHGFANVVGLTLIYTDYDKTLNGLLF